MEWRDRIVRVTGQALRDMSVRPMPNVKDRKNVELDMALRESLDTLGKKSADAQGLGTLGRGWLWHERTAGQKTKKPPLARPNSRRFAQIRAGRA